MSTKSDPSGIGLDIGTMTLISARRTGKGIESRKIRDAFLDLDVSAKKMLKLAGVDFIERSGELILVGDAALEMANVFGKEARRPLSAGLLAAGEIDALEILSLLVKHVAGEPKTPNEVCYFSVPASPIDAPDRDVVYHKGILERIVTDCGYNAIAGNEAMAIIFSETAKEGFSGLSLSFGAGMMNCALSLNTIEAMSFATSRSGDWIDAGAARAVGTTSARMCSIKESGNFSLMSPVGREQEALALYYKSMIEYSLDHITAQFLKVKGQFSLPKPIPLVIGGGTSLAGGFVDFFKEVFEKKKKRFPIEISEIRHATDPLNAVSHGLLLQAIQEADDG